MSKRHSKKRNVGLLYEFLVRTISTALVEGDKRRSNKALKILQRHFQPGTELHKEFRLVNALYRTTVSSDAVAASILGEAKLAVKTHDASKLMREKSLLIREINHCLNDDKFYDQPVADYRTYATIQSLFEEWRSPTGDVAMLAEYEDKLVSWLTTTKQKNPTQVIGDEDPGTIRLLVKMMTRRLNESYSDSLNADQRIILREYALVESTGTNGFIVMLNSLRDRIVARIDEALPSTQEPDRQQLEEAKTIIVNESLSNVDDDVVVRFMLYAKLLDELKGGSL